MALHEQQPGTEVQIHSPKGTDSTHNLVQVLPNQAIR